MWKQYSKYTSSLFTQVLNMFWFAETFHITCECECATYARATLAKRQFFVNRTFVKFDRNLLNVGKLCTNFGKICANFTYKQYIRSVLEYTSPAFAPNLATKHHNTLQTIQNNALRIITGWTQTTPIYSIDKLNKCFVLSIFSFYI